MNLTKQHSRRGRWPRLAKPRSEGWGEGAPIFSPMALVLGRMPVELLVPTALSASCAFMMPVGTPPNAVVFGSGKLTLPQMMKAGVWMNLCFIPLIVAAALFLPPLILG